VSRRIIDTNGAAIQIAETGDGAPALVFLHYWGGSSRTWQAVIDRLGGRPRTIAFDQRGGGVSVATDGRYDLGAMADDAATVAHTLGLDRCVLVGHSIGGKVARVVAKRRPQALVGLVLVAPAPPTPMPVPDAQRAAMLDSYGSRQGLEQALAVLAGGPLSPELRGPGDRGHVAWRARRQAGLDRAQHDHRRLPPDQVDRRYQVLTTGYPDRRRSRF
jgi:pimeloyl-ACP methyl ester carboxylesterase